MILYICPECGAWMIALGLVEALALATTHAEVKQYCKECNAVMEVVRADEKISIFLPAVSPKLVDSPHIKE